ncbi:MAG: glutamine-hydrolyzing GMP synthase [Bdellovibrionales bacterium]|nr:glutamine-hydrolyzing GMP synthase [Bdellovibrionales bacterium]
MEGGFLVLDFGSQYTQIIARRLRELGVFSELIPFDLDLAEIKRRKPSGIILSGGPSSVNEDQAPLRSVAELAQIAPLLGICYGMQLIASQLGGQVESADRREYGLNIVKWKKKFGAVPQEQNVWMSHGDVVKKVPPGFQVAATSGFDYPAVILSDRVWAFQFHPEVSHTDHGLDLLKAFVFDLCQAQANWQPTSITTHLLETIRKQVPEKEHVLCALSGGVDSTVVGTLLTKALGAQRVHCVFVDTGLLRKNEFSQVLETYRTLGLNVKGVDASATFLSRLGGVADPEKKRKIIGHTFIDVFKESIKGLGSIDWLAQGTLYPDVIESISLRGTSVTIKSHHNVGGLPKDLDLKLIEPLRELFKDEVRAIGKELGIAHDVLWRHPFPGPGLAIRVLDEITPANLDILKEVDAVYIDELKAKGLYDKIWQAFCVLLPVKTVGVQGDSRTYERVVAIRAVTSSDGMTADWFAFPPEFLRQLSNRITNEVKGVNRVVYDVTSKPPGTIEWE